MPFTKIIELCHFLHFFRTDRHSGFRRSGLDIGGLDVQGLNPERPFLDVRGSGFISKPKNGNKNPERPNPERPKTP